MKKIKIIVIDDDPKWLKLISFSLSQESDFSVEGMTQSKKDALQLVRTTEFDVALVDINLTEGNFDGIELVKEILNIKNVKIIMITGFFIEELISQSFLSGAVNYILKTDLHDLANLIRVTYKNTSLDILLRDYRKTKQALKLSILTDAEKEVFELVQQNNSIAQISLKLNKSEGTIKAQINKIFKKLGVKTRKEAFEKLDLL